MGVLHPLLPGTPQVTPPKILSAGTPKRAAICKRRLYRRLAERCVVSSANKETLEKSLSSDIKQKHPTDVECFCFGNRRRRVVICSSLRPHRGCGVGLPGAQSLLFAAGKCKPFRRSAFLTKLSAPSLIFPRGCAFFTHLFQKKKLTLTCEFFLLETGVDILSRARVRVIHRALLRCAAKCAARGSPITRCIPFASGKSFRSRTPRFNKTIRTVADFPSADRLLGCPRKIVTVEYVHVEHKTKSSHKRVSFLFWKPASTYSPGPCPAKYHLRG